MRDTYNREFDVMLAQRWDATPHGDRPSGTRTLMGLGAVDTFNDEVIRLQSGKYVFKGDLQRASDLSQVPVFLGQPADDEEGLGLITISTYNRPLLTWLGVWAGSFLAISAATFGLSYLLSAKDGLRDRAKQAATVGGIGVGALALLTHVLSPTIRPLMRRDRPVAPPVEAPAEAPVA